MAAKVVGEFKQRLSGLTLVPSDGGRFEVEVNGDLIHSKLATGSFPDEDAILAQLRARS